MTAVLLLGMTLAALAGAALSSARSSLPSPPVKPSTAPSDD